MTHLEKQNLYAVIEILIVEEEPNVSSFIKRGLVQLGYNVIVCRDGKSAWQLLQKQTFDLILMDAIIPHISGWELCQLFREKFGFITPIIFLTALNSTEYILKGFDSGADDYVIKPFKISELDARIKALRRRGLNSDENKTTLSFADLKLDTNSKQAIRGGEVIDLTAKEYALLDFLMRNPNKVLSRKTILEQVWNLNFDTNTNVVDVYINYIRKKIQDQDGRKLIHTIIGLGYILK